MTITIANYDYEYDYELRLRARARPVPRFTDSPIHRFTVLSGRQERLALVELAV